MNPVLIERIDRPLSKARMVSRLMTDVEEHQAASQALEALHASGWSVQPDLEKTLGEAEGTCEYLLRAGVRRGWWRRVRAVGAAARAAGT